MDVVGGGTVHVDSHAHADGGLRRTLGRRNIDELCQDSAELVLSAEDVVGPFDGDFSDVLVA